MSELRDVRLVLPDDVRITPVGDLPAGLASQLPHQPGDLCVTRSRSRRPSVLVDPATATLLSGFRSPSLVVDAVIGCSSTLGTDPRDLLDDAFAVIRGFVDDGILVPEAAPTADGVRTSLAVGDVVGDVTIVAPVQVLEDSEVYRATHGNRPVALKIGRDAGDARFRESTTREAAVLRHLAGRSAPDLLGVGEHDGRPFVVTSWIDGVNAAAAAAEARSLDDGGRASTALCDAILDAYAGLHAFGVLHGDVHPRNVVVGPGGEVTIIDFGFAHAPDHGIEAPRRGGIDLFLEPEVAAAYLRDDRLPPSSPAGEQYAVAALLYFLITGAHTHSFVLEQRPMLRQVLDEAATSFEQHGIDGLPNVETAVLRALSTSPEDRYPRTTDLAVAFAAAAVEDLRRLPGRRRSSGLRSGAALDGIVDDVLRRTVAVPGLPPQGEPAPTASIVNGAAGVALMLLKVAEVREDEHVLASADLWSSTAFAAAASSVGAEADAFAVTEARRDGIDLGPASLLHHASGVHVVHALVARARADVSTERRAVAAFCSAAAEEGTESDLSFGQAGALIGCCQILDGLHPALDSEATLTIGDRLFDGLSADLIGRDAFADAERGRRLGAAHGYAGELFAILRWQALTSRDVPDGLVAVLDRLAAAGEPTGRAVNWPVVAGETAAPGAVAASWCAGAAGYIPLWLLAATAFDDERYLRLAQRAGWAVVEDSAPAVANLCCGLTGRAYSLLAIYRQLSDPAWLDRAKLIGAQAAATRRDGSHLGLFKGEAGLAMLAADLARPEDSSFPAIERRPG